MVVDKISGPVIVSPDFKRFKDAAPVTLPVTFPLKLAVIVPAVKFPDGSLFTRVLTVLE